MARKKSTEVRTKAAVGRERRLALALRAVLDAIGNNGSEDVTKAYAVLDELGYKDLESVPKRIAALETELDAAFQAKDGARIAELGKALQRAQAGLPPAKGKAVAAEA